MDQSISKVLYLILEAHSHTCTSVMLILVDTSVPSPQQLITSIKRYYICMISYQKCVHWIKVSKKTFDLGLK